MTIAGTPPGGDVNVTSSGSEEGDEEGGALWLPYVVFTFVLLGLILVSFLRFHYKREQQHRLRLETELKYGAKRRRMTPSNSCSNHVTAAMTPAAVVSLDTQRLLTSSSDRNDVRGHDMEVKGHARSRGREPDGDVKRTPVVYTFNTNGSMVDVRCELVERSNTFRLDSSHSPDELEQIHIDAADLQGHFKDIDESRRSRSKSSFKSTYDEESRRVEDGGVVQANHHRSQSSHLIHHQHRQHPQHHQKHRLSPSHHRYRHRHHSQAGRTSLLHPSRLGRREVLNSSDEELSRTAAAAEALLLWQKH